MGKYLLLFVASIFATSTLKSQNDTIYVMKNGGILWKYKISAVDSIIFYKPTLPKIVDADGNVYNSVIIGTQVWMVENLKTTKYNDFTTISLVTDNTTWKNLITPGYCWYGNDEATYKATYGALYNWYAVLTTKLCPTGWHVPTSSDWETLTNYLINIGYSGFIGKSLAATTNWTYINDAAAVGSTEYPYIRNVTGFTALPGGFRRITDGTFRLIGDQGFWWSATEAGSDMATFRYLHYTLPGFDYLSDSYKYGLSVRCVKN